MPMLAAPMRGDKSETGRWHKTTEFNNMMWDKIHVRYGQTIPDLIYFPMIFLKSSHHDRIDLDNVLKLNSEILHFTIIN